jgi:hypothetical protein
MSSIMAETESPRSLPPGEAHSVKKEEKETMHVIENTNDVDTDACTRYDGVAATPSTIYTSSKTVRLLHLVQIYNDVHTQYLQEIYRTMLWHLTQSRRALQARAHPHSVVHAAMLQASLLHPDRCVTAQRRLYPEDNDIAAVTTEGDSQNATIAWNLHVSDEHGGRRNLPPPPLVEEPDESRLIERDTTGLRQRNVSAARASNDVGVVEETVPSVNNSLPDDPLQLLLLSSNGFFTHKTIPPSLQQAQEDAIRLLQYACLLSELQVSMAQILASNK